MKTVPVIIIGAGPVGLSMALALARQGIHSVVIEQHVSTTEHPRARGVNVRTMELFRLWGNASELVQYEQPKEARRIIWAQSLQGEEITKVVMDDSITSSYSPIQSSLVAQDRVEESLYHTLLQYEEVEMRFLRKYVSFEEDAFGVTIRTLNCVNNEEEFIRAQYIIAADGAHSSIRRQLEIEMEGPDNLGQFCSVYCEMDISKWTKHRPCIGYCFTEYSIVGRFLASVDGADRWILGLRFLKENTKNDFTDEHCIEEIRRVTGEPNLSINIINKSFWTMAAQTAKQYRKNRIFLVGDAAHRLPPTGGFGMNTGVQDAHNLAWKLAFVLKYAISDTLLDSYEEERAPIALQNITWSSENATRYTQIYEAIQIGDKELLKKRLDDQHRNLNYSGLDLGFIYHSRIIWSENDENISGTASQYKPSSLPGSRAPHMQLSKNGVEISILDLFEKDFVLLIGSKGQSWKDALNEITSSLSLPIKVYRIAEDGDLIDLDNAWDTIYEMTATGAILVRPDGHIAWRSKSISDTPTETLNRVLCVVLQKRNDERI